MDNYSKSSEYAVQLLTYPPKTIVDFVLGTLDSAVTECMEAMGKSLLQSSLLQDITKDDIEKGLDQLKLRFVKKMEPISCKLEKFLLDVVLNIPDQVLLPEDACQRIKYSAKAQKKILKDIETMKLEILAEKYKNVLFKGKLREASETLENLHALSADIETTTTQVLNDCKVLNLLENAKFVKENIGSLQRKIACLHEVLPQAKASDNDVSLYDDDECLLCEAHNKAVISSCLFLNVLLYYLTWK